MSDQTLLSETERKRSNVSSTDLLNLQSIMTLNNNIEKPKCSLIEENDEIENKKRKTSETFSNTTNDLIECLTSSNFKSFQTRRILISDKQPIIPSSSKRIVIPRDEKEELNTNRSILQSDTRIVIPKTEEGTSMNSNARCSLPSSIPSLLSFSSLISNFDNEEYKARVRHIILSWNKHENEAKSAINSDETISITNKCSTMEFSPNRKVIDTQISSSSSLPIRRKYPKFESVPTPVQQQPPCFLPSDLLDCCNQHENKSDHWDNCYISVELRDTMIIISKRLTTIKSIPIVDTHCHFDLIFDRLYIKHNNIKRYFDDYKDLYPSGLSFELAIQVFWRPRHITEKNWMNWFSNYLNDERVYGSCGIHPHWSSSWSETIIEDIERCLKHPKMIAIGEIGLDFGPKNTCSIDQQCQVFEEQLKLAKKWSKPIVIHSRDAYKQTFDLMKQHLESNHKIHLHCFVGTIDDAYLFTSYFNEIKFGFTPIITRTNFLHTVIQQLDLTQILSETDSPYFVPEELSNLSRCAHPGMVYSVVETIALIRKISVDDVAYQLRENARQIYGV